MTNLPAGTCRADALRPGWQASSPDGRTRGRVLSVWSARGLCLVTVSTAIGDVRVRCTADAPWHVHTHPLR